MDFDKWNYLVLDIETAGTDPRKGDTLLCAAWESNIPGLNGAALEVPDVVKDAIADPSIAFVSHSKYDPRWFRLDNYKVTGPYHDTMKMGHLLNENVPLSLDWQAKKWLGITMDKRLRRKDKKVWFTKDDGSTVELTAEVLKDPDVSIQLLAYCQRDTVTTHQLYLKLVEELTRRTWLPYWLEEEVPYTEVLLDMECRGMPLNLEGAATLKEELTVTASTAKSKLFDDLGYEVNLNSPLQLEATLYSKVWTQADRIEITKEQRDCLRERCDAYPKAKSKTPGKPNDGINHECFTLPTTFDGSGIGTRYANGVWYRKGFGLQPKAKTDGGNWSTTTPTLLTHYGTHPWVKDLVAWRKLDKVIGTYLEAYPRYSYEGRLYGQFNQSGTVTGRLSHSNPNLGNQPAHGPLGTAIRSLFVGNLLIGDHSQLEPRLMGHFSQDPVLLDIYRENRDIYLVTAKYIFGKDFTKDDEERQLCKTLILALGYGAGPPKLAQILSVNGFPTDTDTAKGYLTALQSLYKVFFSWKKHTIHEARAKGYVKTIGGRFRRLTWAFGDAPWKVQSKGERQAVNAIIQGSAGDIMRRNMLAWEASYPSLPLLNQVHDELIAEYDTVPSDPKGTLLGIQKMCENPGYTLTVPLKFEPSFCHSWAEKGGGFIPEIEDDE